MRIWKPLSLLLVVFFLAACNANAGIEEETDYEVFRDTINDSEFSGFAYLLRSPDDNDAGVQSIVDQIFEDNRAELYFLNLPDQNDDVQTLQNEDSRDPNIYHPSNKVAFIDQGEVIDEIDVNHNSLQTSEHNNELASFIQQYQ